MLAKSQLLEPWYAFRLEVPVENIGRAMSDIQRMEAVLIRRKAARRPPP